MQTPRCQILTENGGSGLKESWIRKNDPPLLRVGGILISDASDREQRKECRINKQRCDERFFLEQFYYYLNIIILQWINFELWIDI